MSAPHLEVGSLALSSSGYDLPDFDTVRVSFAGAASGPDPETEDFGGSVFVFRGGVDVWVVVRVDEALRWSADCLGTVRWKKERTYKVVHDEEPFVDVEC